MIFRNWSVLRAPEEEGTINMGHAPLDIRYEGELGEDEAENADDDLYDGEDEGDEGDEGDDEEPSGKRGAKPDPSSAFRSIVDSLRDEISGLRQRLDRAAEPITRTRTTEEAQPDADEQFLAANKQLKGQELLDKIEEDPTYLDRLTDAKVRLALKKSKAEMGDVDAAINARVEAAMKGAEFDREFAADFPELAGAVKDWKANEKGMKAEMAKPHYQTFLSEYQEAMDELRDSGVAVTAAAKRTVMRAAAKIAAAKHGFKSVPAGVTQERQSGQSEEDSATWTDKDRNFALSLGLNPREVQRFQRTGKTAKAGKKGN